MYDTMPGHDQVFHGGVVVVECQRLSVIPGDAFLVCRESSPASLSPECKDSLDVLQYV